ncbi:MAG TPA: phage integrase N-terminal SAM-like domain-containing protein, partial [Allosphingosinicella sp.]|nr:phage integrase N-terminal SAM-like domain-containing protein [Allosphingosinicella sp.]
MSQRTVHHPSLAAPVSPLRQRLIDDMHMRRFSRETQRNYIRDVGRFATFLGRLPDTATAEDLRRFQVEQREAGVPVLVALALLLRRKGARQGFVPPFGQPGRRHIQLAR